MTITDMHFNQNKLLLTKADFCARCSAVISAPGMLLRCREETLSYIRPHRGVAPQKNVLSLSQAARCALFAVTSSIRRRFRRDFSRARSRRTTTRRRTSLARKSGSNAHFAWIRVRGARARACEGERERVCARADPLFFRTDTCIVCMTHTPYQHLTHYLAATHSHIPAYAIGMVRTLYIPKHIPRMIFMYPTLRLSYSQGL